MASATLVVRILSDAKDAGAGLDQAAGKAGKFESAMSKAALPAAAVASGLLLVGKKALDAASDMQQSQGAVESVFGKSADAVEKYADTSATRLGISKTAYNNYAASVGSSLQNAGFSAQQAADMSDKAMGRAADMAATFGGTTADAVEAINAAVGRGEFDSLEKYGMSLNQTAINSELAARGQDKLTGEQLANAKATVALDLIYKKTAKTQGQFAREADSAAGSQQIATAQFDDAAATLGAVLLPIVAKAAAMLGSFASFAEQNATAVQILAGVIGGLAVAVLAINAAYKVWSVTSTALTAILRVQEGQTIAARVAQLASAAATKVVTAAQWLWNAALSANPIGLVIILIVALVAAIIVLWKKSDGFRKLILKVWDAVKDGAKAAAKAVTSAFKAAWSFVTGAAKAYLAAVKTILTAIKTVVGTAVEFVKDKFHDAWGKVSDAVRNTKDAIQTAMATVKTIIGNVVGKVSDLIAKFKNISVPGAIKTAVEKVGDAVENVVDFVEDLIGAIKNIPTPSINWPDPPKWLDKVMPGMMPVPPSPARVTAGVTPQAAPVSRSNGSGGVTIITLDPEGAARLLNRIDRGHRRRVGLRSA